ncbi:MAG TPA: class I SAM-dependent methyltransferase [Acidimicrobiales bacterium]|nr:class I SAM-dependent methyltransferase [Acidimicrobiales bacterium]
MAPRSFLIDDVLNDYLVAHTTPADEVQRSLIAATQALGDISGMQIAVDQGNLLTLLARMVGARRAIEVGTFTGYSALCIARGLPDDGHLLCCDVSAEWTAIGREHWDRAGVGDKIELRIGPGTDTLAALPLEPTFDLAFVDADKPSYVGYVDALVPRLRPGGLLLIDNVLWSGNVVDPAMTDDNTEAIRRCNDHVAAHPDLESLILTIGDGLTLARKRA